MSDKPLLENGRYIVHGVNSVDFKATSDGVVFVECVLNVYVGEYELNTNTNIDNKYTSMDGIVKLSYRLPLTSGAFKKTFSQLEIMGADMKENEKGEIENPLNGVGSKEFYANCVSIECHENEAPGKYRTYVKSIESL